MITGCLAAAAALLAASAAGAQSPAAEDNGACAAVLDTPITAPDLAAETERPEGYIECIQADELFAELMALTTGWIACFEAADAACLAELYDENALLALDGRESLSGRDRIAQHFRSEFSSYVEGDWARLAIRYDSVEAAGGRPVIVQHWRMARSGAGRTETRSGRTLLVLRRDQDGAWRIWREIGNDAPDAAPGDWPEGLF